MAGGRAPVRTAQRRLPAALLLACIACGGDPEPPAATGPVGSSAGGAPHAKDAEFAAAPAARRAAQGSFSGVRLAPASILDRAGFGTPMVAATLFVPHGWQTSGGVAWGEQYSCTNGYAYSWQAQAPDGRSGMLIFPQQRWEWNATGQPTQIGCSIARIDSVQGYLEALLVEVEPGARILDIRPRKDLEAELASLNSESDTGFQYSRSQVSAAEALIEFEQEGERLRGVLAAAVQFNYLRTGGGQYGTAIEHYSGYALPAYGAFGPASSFDPAFFERLRRSMLGNPAWEAQIAQHNLNMGRIALEGVKQRGRIQREAMADIARIQQEAWDNQQQAADIRAREFSEVIRDVETYADAWAPGGQVELDSFYEHAWRLEDGTYVLTNDPSFEPYRELGIDGRILSPTP